MPLGACLLLLSWQQPGRSSAAATPSQSWQPAAAPEPSDQKPRCRALPPLRTASACRCRTCQQQHLPLQAAAGPLQLLSGHFSRHSLKAVLLSPAAQSSPAAEAVVLLQARLPLRLLGGAGSAMREAAGQQPGEYDSRGTEAAAAG